MPRRMRVSGQVTVSTTPLKIFDFDAGRVALLMQEVGGTNAAMVDESNSVSATMGIFLPDGTTLPQGIILQDSACPTGAIWVVRAGAADAVIVFTEILL